MSDSPLIQKQAQKQEFKTQPANPVNIQQGNALSMPPAQDAPLKKKLSYDQMRAVLKVAPVKFMDLSYENEYSIDADASDYEIKKKVMDSNASDNTGAGAEPEAQDETALTLSKSETAIEKPIPAKEEQSVSFFGKVKGLFGFGKKAAMAKSQQAVKKQTILVKDKEAQVTKTKKSVAAPAQKNVNISFNIPKSIKVSRVKQRRNELYERSLKSPESLTEEEKTLADIEKIKRLQSSRNASEEALKKRNYRDEDIVRLDNLGKKQVAGLTNEEKEIVNYYSKNVGYQMLNTYLRTGKLPSEKCVSPPRASLEETAHQSRILKQALAKSKLDHDMYLSRFVNIKGLSLGLGLGPNILDSKDLIAALKGRKIHRTVLKDKGFVSSSTLSGGAPGFNKSQVEMRILAQKGTSGLYMKSLSDFSKEEEVLLQSDTRMEVLAIETTSDYIRKTNSNIDTGEGTGKKIVVYVRARSAEEMEQKEQAENEAIEKKYNEYTNAMMSRAGLMSSESNANFKAGMFGYKRVGNSYEILKAADDVWNGDEVNDQTVRSHMALGIYYARHTEKNVLDGTNIDRDELKKIQQEVETAISDTKSRNGATVVGKLLSEMKKGLIANMTSDILKQLSSSGDNDLGEKIPFLRILTGIQDSYGKLVNALSQDEYKASLAKAEGASITKAEEQSFQKLEEFNMMFGGALDDYRNFLKAKDLRGVIMGEKQYAEESGKYEVASSIISKNRSVLKNLQDMAPQG